MNNHPALAACIAAVRAELATAAMRASRPADAVTLLAVTKNVPIEAIQAAYDLGLRDFGENRMQEAQRKLAALDLPGARWELIGHLQTNKVREAAALFARVQSVDSVRLMERLDAQATRLDRVMPILLEVNAGEEASKLGFTPDDVLDAARTLTRFAHLRAEGLMTVAPIGDEQVVRPVFARMRALRDTLRAQVPQQGTGTDGGWDVLSMGMSDDYATAVEEGATLVRIGRGIFGPRAARGPEAKE
ncbi:MAG: YggS family pyridoxal phosphate-dependent enzyme [Ktedonobacterales bacterium]